MVIRWAFSRYSGATTSEISQRIIDAKGTVDEVIFLGIGGDSECDGPYGSALEASNLREITQTFVDGHKQQALEVDRLIVESELRLTSYEQERATLLRVKDYVQEQFKQLCFARNDFTKLTGELHAKANEAAQLADLRPGQSRQCRARGAAPFLGDPFS